MYVLSERIDQGEEEGEGIPYFGSDGPFLDFFGPRFLIQKVGFWENLGGMVVEGRVSGLAMSLDLRWFLSSCIFH